jgi:hypothetical protein
MPPRFSRICLEVAREGFVIEILRKLPYWEKLSKRVEPITNWTCQGTKTQFHAPVLRAGLAKNVSGVIRISLKNEHGSLKSDQNFLWAVFNGEQEKVVLVFSL